MKKWSLIFFTILSQIAVGAFWTLWIVQLYFSSRFGEVLVESFMEVAFLVVEAIMFLSLLVSLAHLGTPKIAYQAVANLRSSWLSREIFFAVLFTGTSVVFTIMLWGQIGSHGLRAGAAWLAGSFGFMLIYSMSRLYMVRTVPFWNTIYTLLSFFLTALILGGLLVSTIFVINMPGEFLPDRSSYLKIVALISAAAIFLLGAEFVAIPARIVHLLSTSSSGKETVQKLFEKYKIIFSIRLLIGSAGTAILGFMILQARYSPAFYVACFTLVMLAQLSDRYLFYTARDVSGM